MLRKIKELQPRKKQEMNFQITYIKLKPEKSKILDYLKLLDEEERKELLGEMSKKIKSLTDSLQQKDAEDAEEAEDAEDAEDVEDAEDAEDAEEDKEARDALSNHITN